MTAPQPITSTAAGPKPTPAAVTSAVARQTIRRPTPEALADVALIDGPTVAAAGCMSLSSWHELVRKGEAPAPVIRQPRCTRWRLADVRAWLIERASRGSDTEAATRVAATASKASAAAKAKRATLPQARA